MKSRIPIYIGALVVIFVVILSQCIYIVDVKECAVVTFFGKPVRTYLDDPGLKFKWPFPFERITKFDQRLQMLEIPPQECHTLEKKNIMTQAFLVWRISDPQIFLQTMNTQEGLETRLSFAMVSELAAELGKTPFASLISDATEVKLSQLTEKVMKNVQTLAQAEYGVEIVNLQVSRINYHEQNRPSVFDRMREERRQIATRHRSEGESEAMKIRAGTDRERANILAEAESTAARIRGEGEAEAARIYAEAITNNPEFYRFYRSLQMYETILTSEDSAVIPGDSDLMRFLWEGSDE